MSESAVEIVQNVIQRVYGDATQTVLDHTAASQIVAALRQAGWASLDEVALLIEAAGGKVTVPDSLLMSDHNRVVTVEDDYAARGRTFRVERGSARAERMGP